MKDTAERAGCLIDAIKQRTKESKANAARYEAAARAAEKEIKVISQSEACFDYLRKGRDEKKFSREAVLESAGGKLTVENSCLIARKFGFGQRASIEALQVPCQFRNMALLLALFATLGRYV